LHGSQEEKLDALKDPGGHDLYMAWLMLQMWPGSQRPHKKGLIEEETLPGGHSSQA